MNKPFSIQKCVVAMSLLLILSTNAHAQLFGLGAKKNKIEVGVDSPDFSGENFLTNANISYSKDIKGKVILLDFWSIYCVSCLHEIPKLVEIFNKYKDKNIYFIGVDLDTNTRRLNIFLKDPDKATPYPIVMDKDRKIANLFNVNILPTTVIIGPDGKIKLYHEGYKPGDENHIEEVIKTLFGE